MLSLINVINVHDCSRYFLLPAVLVQLRFIPRGVHASTLHPVRFRPFVYNCWRLGYQANLFQVFLSLMEGAKFYGSPLNFCYDCFRNLDEEYHAAKFEENSLKLKLATYEKTKNLRYILVRSNNETFFKFIFETFIIIPLKLESNQPRSQATDPQRRKPLFLPTPAGGGNCKEANLRCSTEVLHVVRRLCPRCCWRGKISLSKLPTFVLGNACWGILLSSSFLLRWHLFR